MTQKSDPDEGWEWEEAHRFCMRIAYRYANNPSEAEDIAQDALLRAWRRRSTLREAERRNDWLATIVDLFAVDPKLARTAIVEVAAAGADARQRHWNAVARFTEYLEDGRELADGRELPENISLMSAGAVSGLIFDELLAGRAAQLPALLPDLLFAMLVPYIGPRAAADEMRRVAAAR